MAKITIEELSDSLKEHLNGLGLTEAQVQELIDNMQEEVIGNKEELATSNKSSLVAAINELFQNANNGKQIIADAIGSPLSSDDTFAAMGNIINRLTTDFRNALALKGVNAPGDKFETLINRIDEIVQSGNVLNNQIMVSGEYVAPKNYIPRGGYDEIISIDLNLDFDPEYFFIYFSNLGNKQDPNLNGYSWTESVILSTDCPEVLLNAAYNPSGYGGSDTRFRLSYDRTTANVTLIRGSYGSNAYVKQGDIIRWYAIGSSHLPNNGGERTITPSTSDQVLPDGYYSGDITVKGDSDLKPENIVEGVEIFGVNGIAKKSNTPPTWFTGWIFAQPITTPVGSAAVAAVDDKIYCIAGQRYATGAFNGDNTQFDTTTNTWKDMAKLSVSKSSSVAETVNGKIYILAGSAVGASGSAYNSNHCYDPTTNSYTAKANIITGRYETSSAKVNNKIYVIGGFSSNGHQLQTNECYDPETDTWTTKKSMTYARGSLSSCSVGENIYSLGGYNNGATNECYDTITNTWSIKTALPTDRILPISEAVGNKIYCIGGCTSNGSNIYNINECYDVINDKWSTVGMMPTARYGSGSVVVNNNIYVIGGYVNFKNDSTSRVNNNECFMPN